MKAAAGSILLGGCDIARLSLTDLRKTLSLVPQDPVLMAGSILSNLDPEGLSNPNPNPNPIANSSPKPNPEHEGLSSDEDVWEILTRVNVADAVKSKGGLLGA